MPNERSVTICRFCQGAAEHQTCREAPQRGSASAETMTQGDAEPWTVAVGLQSLQYYTSPGNFGFFRAASPMRSIRSNAKSGDANRACRASISVRICSGDFTRVFRALAVASTAKAATQFGFVASKAIPETEALSTVRKPN